MKRIAIGPNTSLRKSWAAGSEELCSRAIICTKWGVGVSSGSRAGPMNARNTDSSVAGRAAASSASSSSSRRRLIGATRCSSTARKSPSLEPKW